MGTKAITIRTEDETIAEIDGLARAMDRSRNYVVNQAMLAYVASAGAAPPEAIEPSDVESAESDGATLRLNGNGTAKKQAKADGKKKKDRKKKKARKKSKK